MFKVMNLHSSDKYISALHYQTNRVMQPGYTRVGLDDVCRGDLGRSNEYMYLKSVGEQYLAIDLICKLFLSTERVDNYTNWH